MIRLRSFLAFAFIAAISIASAFHMGLRIGYNQGWSDAHCGVGNQCESGQE